MVVCRAPRTETTSPEHALPESSSKVGALMVLAPASSKRGWLLRKAGALLSTQPHSEANGRASQLASERGQADRHDNVFVYGPATVRCKEMSKKKKKVQVGVSTIPKSRWSALCPESGSQATDAQGTKMNPFVLL